MLLGSSKKGTYFGGSDRGAATYLEDPSNIACKLNIKYGESHFGFAIWNSKWASICFYLANLAKFTGEEKVKTKF